jgi:hypothetical protein
MEAFLESVEAEQRSVRPQAVGLGIASNRGAAEADPVTATTPTLTWVRAEFAVSGYEETLALQPNSCCQDTPAPGADLRAQARSEGKETRGGGSTPGGSVA